MLGITNTKCTIQGEKDKDEGENTEGQSSSTPTDPGVFGREKKLNQGVC